MFLLVWLSVFLIVLALLFLSSVCLVYLMCPMFLLSPRTFVIVAFASKPVV